MDIVLEGLLDQEYDDIYSKYSLVNFNRLNEVEDELINSKEYLPFQIRRYLKTDYLKYLQSNNGKQEVIDKIVDGKFQPVMFYVEEYIDWVNKHKEYKDLLDTEEYNQFIKETDEIRKEYENLNLW